MERSEAKILLCKYNLGEATADEIAILESWYLNEGFKSPLIEDEFDYEAKRLSILSKIQQQRAPVTKTIMLWPRIAITAAVVTVIFAAGLFFYNNQKKEVNGPSMIVDDLAPGHHGATLILGSGKKIKLSEAVNGQLASEAGVSISKAANGQLVYQVRETSEPSEQKENTLATSKGETYQVRLPDGSTVWLNAASSLTYNVNLFQGGKRIVELKGEGYFAIAKDPAHPFVVNCGNQQAEVLGTHFNVNAYSGENIKTTLVEGAVKVTASGGYRLLRPGQQSLVSGDHIKVSEVDAEDVAAWKDGVFVFDEEPLGEIMEKIARWYDVDIAYQDEALKKKRFSGSVSRSASASQVLKKLQQVEGVKFTINENRIIVSKK